MDWQVPSTWCKIIVIALITSMTPVMTAHASDRADTGQHAKLEAKSRPWPRSCSEQTADLIRAFTNGRHKLTAQQSFRLAVLRGDSQRVSELHSTFPLPGVEDSKRWGDRQQRLETMQVALDDAAMTNQLAMVALLVKYGASPNFVTQWPTIPAIMVAAGCGNIAAMDMLYKLGADPSAPAFDFDNHLPPSNVPSNAIEVAVGGRQNAAVLWLVHHGVDVCGKRESKRIAHFKKYGYAKGQLSDDAIKALQCP